MKFGEDRVAERRQIRAKLQREGIVCGSRVIDEQCTTRHVAQSLPSPTRGLASGYLEALRKAEPPTCSRILRLPALTLFAYCLELL